MNVKFLCNCAHHWKQYYNAGRSFLKQFLLKQLAFFVIQNNFGLAICFLLTEIHLLGFRAFVGFSFENCFNIRKRIEIILC